MIKLTTVRKPKSRIELWGSKVLALGINKKCIMVRSKLLGLKIQLNFKGEL